MSSSLSARATVTGGCFLNQNAMLLPENCASLPHFPPLSQTAQIRRPCIRPEPLKAPRQRVINGIWSCRAVSCIPSSSFFQIYTCQFSDSQMGMCLWRPPPKSRFCFPAEGAFSASGCDYLSAGQSAAEISLASFRSRMSIPCSLAKQIDSKALVQIRRCRDDRNSAPYRSRAFPPAPFAPPPRCPDRSGNAKPAFFHPYKGQGVCFCFSKGRSPERQSLWLPQRQTHLSFPCEIGAVTGVRGTVTGCACLPSIFVFTKSSASHASASNLCRQAPSRSPLAVKLMITRFQ